MIETPKPPNTKKFKTNKLNYHTRFTILLDKIYSCYESLIKDEIKIPIKENEIRDLLVDKYLNNITDYTFEKEEKNNLGRVDIFIVQKLSIEQPKFIIECKLLDNKNMTGTTGLNSEYIKNGVYRFLTEYYFIDNKLNTNAMIGFIIKELDIDKNILALNSLSKILLKNLIDITQEIQLHRENIYKSNYYTCTKKDFTVYHLMMDFSK